MFWLHIVWLHAALSRIYMYFLSVDSRTSRNSRPTGTFGSLLLSDYVYAVAHWQWQDNQTTRYSPRPYLD